MRRLIAYLALTSTLTLGAAACVSPLVLQMDADLAYAEGKTLYFKASNYDAASLVGNYENFLTEEDKDGDTYIVSKIADTMRERLDIWGVSDYEVETQGYDTIAVSLRSSNNKDLEYAYLESYLSFSGGHYEVDASNTTGGGSAGDEEEDGRYNHNDLWDTMLDGKTARFHLLDQGGYQVPVVLIPIDDEHKTAFTDLITYCNNNTVAEEKDQDGNVTTEGKSCNLVIWANRLESDRYEDRSDANVASHIFFETATGNDQAVYYESGDSDKEHPFLQLIPSSKATESGTYDPNYAQEATDAANFLMNKFNASAYEYRSDHSGSEDSVYRVHFTYSEDKMASVDRLVHLGDFFASPSMGRTMATVLAIVAFTALFLAFFERFFTFSHMAVMGVTTVGTLATFIAFGTQFNISALLALGAVALVSLFQSLFFTSRFRNEVYKGRTLKKAEQEASKMSVLPSIDAGILAIVLGVCLYLLGGSVLRAGGVMLAIGGFYSIFSSLILTRLFGWILCNDNTINEKFAGFLRIKKDKIPNLMEQEKQSYFGPYQEKDFTKSKKYAGIVASLLVLVGIGSTIGFGVANGGNIYNFGDDTAHTVLRMEVKSSEEDRITVDGFSSIADLYDPEGEDHADLFHQYSIDGKPLADYVVNFALSETPKTVYETPEAGSEGTNYYYFFYEAELSASFDLNEEYTIKEWSEVENTYVDFAGTSLIDLSETIAELGGSDLNDVMNVSVAFAPVATGEQAPYVGDVCLGIGIALAVSFVYLAFRYRLSRGLAISILTFATSFMALSFFVYTRIAVNPTVTLGLILGVISALLVSLFLLNREKELRKEDHENDRNSLAKRSEQLKKATSYEAENVEVFGVIALYIPLFALCFGPLSYGFANLLAILAVVFSAVLILVLLSPLSDLFAKWFSHIKIKPRKGKKKAQTGNLMKKKRSGEPEEAIFIGIND